MIAYNNNTKNAYKNNVREINVTGNLYLAKKRVSKNEFDVYGEKQDTNTTSRVNSNDDLIINLDSSVGTNLARTTIKVNLKPNTYYTITTNFTRNNTEIATGMFGVRETASGGSWLGSVSIPQETSDTLSKTFNSGSYTEAYVWFYVKSSINISAVTTEYRFSQIMLAEGTTTTPYELYGTTQFDYDVFELTESNQCKIIGFEINEKSDIYYTSLPYNTMIIDVDNEKGYFTDYDDDSIVNKLNNDCYVDLVLNINSGTNYITRRMYFDKISYSDYEIAKLSFISVNSILKNLPLKDKLLDFKTRTWGRSRLQSWFSQNYNIDYIYTGSNITTLNTTNLKSTSVENILLESSTYYGTLENAVLITNNYLNKIVLRNFLSSPQETITKDYQLEKPTIKRENTYQGVSYRYINSSSYVSSTETYTRTISGTLSQIKETIVYRDNDYRIYDLIASDLTASSGITISVDKYSYNLNMILITIQGDIGQEYTITINKANIYKRASDEIKEEKIGLVNETSKVLTINEGSPLLSTYYNLILNEKKIRSYVEVQMMALPYLEVGDTIEVQTDNANILITITEINMTYDGGLLETIKGYELGWDALYPSDTLYPNDELYPNTPI